MASQPETGLTQRAVIREAWREWKVNASVHGHLIAAPRPARQWIDEELGFGAGEGPSLQLTLVTLEQRNRHGVKRAAYRARRESGAQRQKRLLNLASAALAKRKHTRRENVAA